MVSVDRYRLCPCTVRSVIALSSRDASGPLAAVGASKDAARARILEKYPLLAFLEGFLISIKVYNRLFLPLDYKNPMIITLSSAHSGLLENQRTRVSMLEGRESQVLSYSHFSYIFKMCDRVTIQCVPVLINASDVSFGEVLQCSIRIAVPILVVELACALGSSHIPVALCHKWVPRSW